MTSRAEAAELPFAMTIHDRFREDAPGRVARAQKQYVINFLCHGQIPTVCKEVFSRRSCTTGGHGLSRWLAAGCIASRLQGNAARTGFRRDFGVVTVDWYRVESVKRLPRDSLRVRDPILIGVRVTARSPGLLDQCAIGPRELRAHRGEFLSGIHLKSQMIDRRRGSWREGARSRSLSLAIPPMAGFISSPTAPVGGTSMSTTRSQA